MAFRWTKREREIIEFLDVFRWQTSIRKIIQQVLRTAIELGKLPDTETAQGEIQITRLVRSLDQVEKDLSQLAKQLAGRNVDEPPNE